MAAPPTGLRYRSFGSSFNNLASAPMDWRVAPARVIKV